VYLQKENNDNNISFLLMAKGKTNMKFLSGLEKYQSIQLEPELLGKCIAEVIKDSLRLKSVTVADLALHADFSWFIDGGIFADCVEGDGDIVKLTKPDRQVSLIQWLEQGVPFFDAVYYDALPVKTEVNIVITINGNIHDEEKQSEIATTLGERNLPLQDVRSLQDVGLLITQSPDRRFKATADNLGWLFVYMLIRGNPVRAEDTTVVEKAPKFMVDQMSFGGSLQEMAGLVSSFSLAKIDPRWIKAVPLDKASITLLSRLGLGVAGYRLFRPFQLYKPKGRVKYSKSELIALCDARNISIRDISKGSGKRYKEPREIYNARRSAILTVLKIADQPLDWDIHPLTRPPQIISKFGGFNKPIQNLINISFSQAQIADMLRNKVIAVQPITNPSANIWKTWNPDNVPKLNNPILPGSEENAVESKIDLGTYFPDDDGDDSSWSDDSSDDEDYGGETLTPAKQIISQKPASQSSKPTSTKVAISQTSLKERAKSSVKQPKIIKPMTKGKKVVSAGLEEKRQLTADEESVAKLRSQLEALEHTSDDE